MGRRGTEVAKAALALAAGAGAVALLAGWGVGPLPRSVPDVTGERLDGRRGDPRCHGLDHRVTGAEWADTVELYAERDCDDW